MIVLRAIKVLRMNYTHPLQNHNYDTPPMRMPEKLIALQDLQDLVDEVGHVNEGNLAVEVDVGFGMGLGGGVTAQNQVNQHAHVVDADHAIAVDITGQGDRHGLPHVTVEPLGLPALPLGNGNLCVGYRVALTVFINDIQTAGFISRTLGQTVHQRGHAVASDFIAGAGDIIEGITACHFQPGQVILDAGEFGQ